jgi:hypothetical protein
MHSIGMALLVRELDQQGQGNLVQGLTGRGRRRAKPRRAERRRRSGDQALAVGERGRLATARDL